MKKKAKIGCFAVLGLFLVLFAVAVGLLFLTVGRLGREIQQQVVAMAGASGDAEERGDERGAPTGWAIVTEGLAAGGTTMGSIIKGELRYRVPDALWRGEVRSLFPIEQDVAGFVKVRLSNPRLVADADPSWLQMQVDMEAQVYRGGNERFPGRVAVRSRLRADRAGRRVVLTDAQLVEFTFSGTAAAVADALRDVLAEAVAAELQDFEVFTFGEGGEWWRESGAKFVREVTVHNHGVVVVIGW